MLLGVLFLLQQTVLLRAAPEETQISEESRQKKKADVLKERELRRKRRQDLQKQRQDVIGKHREQMNELRNRHRKEVEEMRTQQKTEKETLRLKYLETPSTEEGSGE